MNNYRPISLLSVFDKIMEKLMHKRLYSYLEDSDIYIINNLDLGKVTPLLMQ